MFWGSQHMRSVEIICCFLLYVAPTSRLLFLQFIIITAEQVLWYGLSYKAPVIKVQTTCLKSSTHRSCQRIEGWRLLLLELRLLPSCSRSRPPRGSKKAHPGQCFPLMVSSSLALARRAPSSLLVLPLPLPPPPPLSSDTHHNSPAFFL